jgi:Sortase domain
MSRTHFIPPKATSPITLISVVLIVAGALSICLALVNRPGTIPSFGASSPAGWPLARSVALRGAAVAPGVDTTMPSTVTPIGVTGSRLVIPALRVDAPLIPTGAVGQPGIAALTIPEDVHEVGWWDGTVNDGASTRRELAPEPGQPGVALIAGHVDSAATGPGALYDLKDLRAGDSIELSGALGITSDWVVTGVPMTTAKNALPKVLFVTTGVPRLALVSCGGPFDLATGHYRDNVIVWAVPAVVA